LSSSLAKSTNEPDQSKKALGHAGAGDNQPSSSIEKTATSREKKGGPGTKNKPITMFELSI